MLVGGRQAKASLSERIIIEAQMKVKVKCVDQCSLIRNVLSDIKLRHYHASIISLLSEKNCKFYCHFHFRVVKM